MPILVVDFKTTVPMKKLLLAFLAGSMALLMACDPEEANNSDGFIKLDKTSAEMSVGETLQLTATVATNLADGPKVVWSSDNLDVATVTTEEVIAVDGTYLPAGLVTAVGAGEAVITASIEGHEAQCKITVKKSQAGGDGLIVNPDKVTIGKNDKLQLSVTDAAGKAVKATWSSTDTMVAVVDDNNILEARNPGSAVVTATADGKTGTCQVTVVDEIAVVSIAFEKDYVEMNLGETYQLKVVFNPENATNKTINHWFVDGGNPTVTVDDKGVVTAKQKGTAIVGAAIDPERIARCTIKVIDPENPDIQVESITLDQTTATISTQQAEPLILTATVKPAEALKDKSIEWKSSNPNVLSVSAISATQAKVAGLAVGKETVTAYIGGQSASCEVTVQTASTVAVESVSLDKNTLDMTIGDTFALTATVSPDNATNKTVSWTSSNPDVASVANGSGASAGGTGVAPGTVTAKSAGEATITASAGGKSATCKVTVKEQTYEEVVDLGLSVKWRAWNLGATKPYEFGDYYAWAEVDTYYEGLEYGQTWGIDVTKWKDGKSKGYNWESNRYWKSGYLAYQDGDNHLIVTKYNTHEGNGTVDNKLVLDPDDDAAHVILKNGWRMPTKDEWQELLDNCTAEYINNAGYIFQDASNPGLGVRAVKFTSKKNGKSILFPRAGFIFNKDPQGYGSYGYYWTSNLIVSSVATNGTENEWAPGVAWICCIYNATENYLTLGDRMKGYSIRPVKD